MKISNCILVSFICAIFVATLRIISYSFFYDGSFFTDFNIFSIISVSISLVSLAFPLIFNIKYKKYDFYLIKTPHTALGITTAICSIPCAFSVYLMWEKFIKSTTNSDVNNIIQTNMGFSFETPLLAISVILLVFLLITMILFFKKKKQFFSASNLLASIPIIWGFVLVIYSYVHSNSSLLVSENLYSVLIPCSTTMSIICFAQIVFYLDKYASAFKKLLIAFSVSTPLCIGYFISNMILMLLKIKSDFSLPFYVQIITVAISILISVFMLGAKFQCMEFYKRKDFIKDNKLEEEYD